jgi:hypothetical protein
VTGLLQSACLTLNHEDTPQLPAGRTWIMHWIGACRKLAYRQMIGTLPDCWHDGSDGA